MVDSKRQLIENYFLIMQLFKGNRTKAIEFFRKYENVLTKRLVDCFQDFTNQDFKIFSKITPEMRANALSVFDEELNGKILFYNDKEFPELMKKVADFPLVIFYHGNPKLLSEGSISIVGTRTPTDEAIYNAGRIARFLVKNDVPIVSGLAKGVDYLSHMEGVNTGYTKLVGVIGTPVNKYYPKENKNLQDYISKSGLLISEYASYENTLKFNFLRRNYVMSAISLATIVVEAGDTSGTINQARSSLKNRRPLFVPEKVFSNPDNKWPNKFREEYGIVYRFRSLSELEELIKENIRENVKFNS